MDLFGIIQQFNSQNKFQLDIENMVYCDELKEMRRRIYRKLLKMEYQLETLGDKYTAMKRLEERYSAELKVKTAKAHNNLYVWITINPKPGVPFLKFFQKMEKLVKRNIFTDYFYVYEQRGDCMENLGKGFHAHILATRNLNYKPSKVARNVRNSCKQIVGDIKSNNQVNIQFIGEEYAADKKEYITGMNKTGEGKDKKQMMDIIWRQKNSLKLYYNAQKAQSNQSENSALQGTVKTPAEVC